jgi:hypothetical protein
MLEGAHFDDTDEGIIDLCLTVKLGKESREVIAYEMGLVVSCRVEGGESQSTDTLYEYYQ